MVSRANTFARMVSGIAEKVAWLLGYQEISAFQPCRQTLDGRDAHTVAFA